MDRLETSRSSEVERYRQNNPSRAAWFDEELRKEVEALNRAKAELEREKANSPRLLAAYNEQVRYTEKLMKHLKEMQARLDLLMTENLELKESK